MKSNHLDDLLDEDDGLNKGTVTPNIVIDAQSWAEFKAALDFLNRLTNKKIGQNTIMERLTFQFIDYVEGVTEDRLGAAGVREFNEHMDQVRNMRPEATRPKVKRKTTKSPDTLVYNKKKGTVRAKDDDDDE